MNKATKEVESTSTEKIELKTSEKISKKTKKEVLPKEVKATPAEEPKEMTLEEMKQDPETQKNMRNLAAEIDRALPGKWINYARYVKYFRGVQYEVFLSIVNTLREFDLAVVKADDRSGEIKMRIDYSKEIELSLINDDIAFHQRGIDKLMKRKKFLEEVIKERLKEGETQ